MPFFERINPFDGEVVQPDGTTLQPYNMTLKGKDAQDVADILGVEAHDKVTKVTVTGVVGGEVTEDTQIQVHIGSEVRRFARGRDLSERNRMLLGDYVSPKVTVTSDSRYVESSENLDYDRRQMKDNRGLV